MDELGQALAEMALVSMELTLEVQRRTARAFERLQRNYIRYGAALAMLQTVGWTRGRLKAAVGRGNIEKTYWKREAWLLRRHVEKCVELGRREAEETAERLREEAARHREALDYRQDRDTDDSIPADEGPREIDWILTRAAAQILGTSDRTVRNLVKAGQLQANMEHEWLPGWKARKNYFLFDRAKVERLAAKRASEAEERQVRWRSRIGQWGDRSTLEVRMAVGNSMDFGWCSAPEVAEALGISVGSVYQMVRVGILPAQQAKPGRQGSPLRIPWWYVMCLQNRESYRERRERVRKGMEPGERKYSVWEKHPIRPARSDRPNKAVEHDYGDYYIGRQVARMFGVTTGTVRRWVGRGKLKAHYKPRKTWFVDGIPYESKGNRWMFFLKEDVHALMRDPAYRKWHAVYVYGRSEEAKAKREAKRSAELDRQLDAHEKARRNTQRYFEDVTLMNRRA